MKLWAAVVCVLLGCPTWAQAATVRSQFIDISCGETSGNPCVERYLRVRASPGEQNNLTVRELATGISVADPGGGLRASGSCRRRGSTSVFCSGEAFADIRVSLRDGDDSVRLSNVSGAGVYSNVMGAVIKGGRGADRIVGSNSNLAITGGPGGDVMGSTGRGGATISYADHRAAVRLTVNGTADDGASGEGDDVFGNVVAIVGGGGPDALEGTESTTMLDGQGGNDQLSTGGGPGVERTILGGDGDDTLRGGAGNDSLGGGLGADSIGGGPGADTVTYLDVGLAADRPTGIRVTFGDGANDGSPGEGDDVLDDVENAEGTHFADELEGNDAPNVLAGLGGPDTIRGGAGDDRLLAVDDGYPDLVDAGPGRDRVRADSNDRVLTADGSPDRVSCRYSAIELEWDASDTFENCAEEIFIPDHGVFRLRTRRVKLPLECAAESAVPCAGHLTLSHRGSTIARQTFRGIEPGTTRQVSVRLRRVPRTEWLVRLRTVSIRTAPRSTTVSGSDIFIVRKPRISARSGAASAPGSARRERQARDRQVHQPRVVGAQRQVGWDRQRGRFGIGRIHGKPSPAHWPGNDRFWMTGFALPAGRGYGGRWRHGLIFRHGRLGASVALTRVDRSMSKRFAPAP